MNIIILLNLVDAAETLSIRRIIAVCAYFAVAFVLKFIIDWICSKMKGRRKKQSFYRNALITILVFDTFCSAVMFPVLWCCCGYEYEKHQVHGAIRQEEIKACAMTIIPIIERDCKYAKKSTKLTLLTFWMLIFVLKSRL